MGSAVKEIKNSTWSNRQNELKSAGLTTKQAQRLHVECRKLTILEAIKQKGGPFTSSEEVDAYLSDSSVVNESACEVK